MQPWDLCWLEAKYTCGLVLGTESRGLRENTIPGEGTRAEQVPVISGVYPSVWEVSPTVCGNVNRKHSLFPEDPQTREGDRQHATLNAMGLSGGAFQGHLCWEQTHLWPKWSLQSV